MKAPVNVTTALASFDEIYSPRIVARMNDYDVRVAHVEGEHLSGSLTAYPVPGTGVWTDLKSADGWTADRGDERFLGYLVRLATPPDVSAETR
jgi:hypothetical protein